MIILDEKRYAEERLEQKNIGENPYFTLNILSRYYYQCLGYRRKKIHDLLLEFLRATYPKYITNSMGWEVTIDKLASKASKKPLYIISGISITQAELDTIAGINNKVLERLAFTMLCLAKYHNARNPENNSWVNTDSKDIFKLARISCTSIEREEKIGALHRMGLLQFSQRIDNTNCQVTFVNDNSEEILFIQDYRELGYEYLKYKGGNFIRCAECGILTRGNKYGNKKYCKNCAAYTPQETKTIVCEDCGKMFQVIGSNKRTIRCMDCQNAINKEKKRLWKQQNAQ